MSETMREALSALMDGESSELELERILSRLASDSELRRTWARYAIAQQVLHGHALAHPQWDISARVQRALPVAQAPEFATRTTPRQRFLRPLTSLAIAASVALTVVVGGRQLAQFNSSIPYGEPKNEPVAMSSPVSMPNSFGNTTVLAGYGTQEAMPALQPATRSAYQELAQQRLRQYMQAHAEQAALNSPQGLVLYSRVPEIRE